jgi:soluble lytic murein transglycosylase-like protein
MKRRLATIILCIFTAWIFIKTTIRKAILTVEITGLPQRFQQHLQAAREVLHDLFFGTGPPELEYYIREAALRYEVDPALIRAVIAVESGGNPHAISRKGAIGLMQLMPATIRDYHVTNPFEPAQNIHAGTRHLKRFLDEFQDLELALAAYNAGPKTVRQHRSIPPYLETINYIQRIKTRLTHP